jgi:hypothetical protein
MTKTIYNSERFDALALRLFAVASDLKALGRTLEEERLADFELHDRKPQEWLAKLEAWTAVARRKLKDEMLRELGARKAREVLEREGRRRGKGKRVRAEQKGE